MTDTNFSLTRRSALFAAVASLLQTSTLIAGEKQVITVHMTLSCAVLTFLRPLTTTFAKSG
jgi:hypothetical protein